jgi:hypothetical protein
VPDSRSTMGWNAIVKEGSVTSVRQAPHFGFEMDIIKSLAHLHSEAYRHSGVRA